MDNSTDETYGENGLENPETLRNPEFSGNISISALSKVPGGTFFNQSVLDSAPTAEGTQMETRAAMTALYLLILVVGLVGNTLTCIVIGCHRYMHTATNFYLFSMSVSDLLLLLTGLPFELYSFWVTTPGYQFGELFCVLRGLCAEASTNASILTIVSFTVERYLAICHPLRQHGWSSLGRTARTVALLWLLAIVCACFPAAQFGIRYERDADGTVLEDSASCDVIRHLFPHAFEASTFLFFLVPMAVISVLYIRIGLRLRDASGKRGISRDSVHGGTSGSGAAARRAVINMLVAVVVVFFICWAPFHAQRLIATYAPSRPSHSLVAFMRGMNHVSGLLYYVSTCTNPILYHVMSAKFRQAVKDTFGPCICSRSCCVKHQLAGGRGSPAATRTTEVTTLVFRTDTIECKPGPASAVSLPGGEQPSARARLTSEETADTHL